MSFWTNPLGTTESFLRDPSGVTTRGLEKAGTDIEAGFGNLTGSTQAAAAAEEAARIQAEAAQAGAAGIAPWLQAGGSALTAQSDLLGLNGPEAQAAAMAQLEQSPQFAAMTRQGEEAMLQNAAATGGLRGGNIQGALAQFRPQLLNQQLQQQLGQLGTISAMGANAGTGTASLLGQAGQAQAGGVLAAGQQRSQNFGNLLQLGGMVYGAGGFGRTPQQQTQGGGF